MLSTFRTASTAHETSVMERSTPYGVISPAVKKSVV
jgi:hypothetical protein